MNFDNCSIPGAAGHSRRHVVRWLTERNLAACRRMGQDLVQLSPMRRTPQPGQKPGHRFK